MSTDTTFITNEGENNLRDRFEILLADTRFFDVLVGYFYSSGFYTILNSLLSTEKIRILIGIRTDQKALDAIQEGNKQLGLFELSHAETKQQLGDTIIHEMELSEDNPSVDDLPP